MLLYTTFQEMLDLIFTGHAQALNEYEHVNKTWVCSVVVKALCYKLEGRGFETR
jgi:hypothetical protein